MCIYPQKLFKKRELRVSACSAKKGSNTGPPRRPSSSSSSNYNSRPSTDRGRPVTNKPYNTNSNNNTPHISGMKRKSPSVSADGQPIVKVKKPRHIPRPGSLATLNAASAPTSTTPSTTTTSLALKRAPFREPPKVYKSGGSNNRPSNSYSNKTNNSSSPVSKDARNAQKRINLKVHIHTHTCILILHSLYLLPLILTHILNLTSYYYSLSRPVVKYS